MRKWRFTVGLDTVEVSDCDFWLDYRAEMQADGQTALSVVLRSSWEHGSLEEADGLKRRTAVEDRLRALRWDFVGRKGSLEIDYETDREREFHGITFKAISPQLAKSNELLVYDLTFEYPVSKAGTEVARTLQFAGKNVPAENFLIEYDQEDRTVFKEVWRAAPMRIPGGPGLKTIRIRSIKRIVSGADSLEKRQAAENEVRDWAWNYKGTAGNLTVDGDVDLGGCHLREVKPSNLALPDAVVYELEFATGYGQ